MENIRFSMLLFPICLTAMQLDNAPVFAKLGETINMPCFYHSQMAMHFSWYKHELGQNPLLISTIYKYDQKAMFYHNFKDSPRFAVLNEKGVHQLVIRNLQVSDSATYYCGSAYSNVLEFIQGTELIVEGLLNYTVVPQHAIYTISPGDTVSLQCTVLNQSCVGNSNVYWLKHKSEPSSPRIINVHRMTNAQCKWTSDAGYRARKCVYKLPKRDFSHSDAGTYYCAVVACGEILFGNGTRLNIIGADSSEAMSTFVLLSIVRTLLFLITVTTITFWYCMNSKRIARASCSSPAKAIRK